MRKNINDIIRDLEIRNPYLSVILIYPDCDYDCFYFHK